MPDKVLKGFPPGFGAKFEDQGAGMIVAQGNYGYCKVFLDKKNLDEVPEEVIELVKNQCANLNYKELYVCKALVEYKADKTSVNTEQFRANVSVQRSGNRIKPQWEIKQSPATYYDLHWIGEAYVIIPEHYSDSATFSPHFIVAATKEQYEATYSRYRPDLLEKYPAWNDLMYVCSGHCERNGPEHTGSVMHCMTHKQYSVKSWIDGTLAPSYPGTIINKGVTSSFKDRNRRLGKLKSLQK